MDVIILKLIHLHDITQLIIWNVIMCENITSSIIKGHSYMVTNMTM